MELKDYKSLSLRVNIILFLLLIIIGVFIVGYFYLESQKSWIDTQMTRAENIIRINEGHSYGINITDINKDFRKYLDGT